MPLRRHLLIPVLAALALFGVLAPASPALAQTINSFTPSSGGYNTAVLITGSGFTGATSVKFNGAPAAFVVNSDTKITTHVPYTASTGPISVTTSAGTGTSSTSFTVSPSASLTPAIGPPMSTVTIHGLGFGAYEGIDLYFDTTDVALVGTNGTGNFSFSVTVPASATPGTHWISAKGEHSGWFAQVAFTVRTNWAQFGFGTRHQRTNPYENVLSPSNVGQIDLDWSYTTGALVESSPAVVNGVLYVGSDDHNVYALNATTGAKLWSYTTGGNVTSSPAVAGGIVYVGSQDGNVYALNASTGAKLWNFPTSGTIRSSPTVANGVVYVGSGNGIVYALNGLTGVYLGSYTTAGGVVSSPVVVNGVVYVGSYDGFVYALNASNLNQIWSYPSTVGFGATDSSPVVANGVVYVGGGDGHVYALTASSGAFIWSFTPATGLPSAFHCMPAVANGVVYVSSIDGHVYALNASSGAQLWSFGPIGYVRSSPAIANGVVYVGGDNSKAYALNASTGAYLWSYWTDGAIESSPDVVNGVVYVASFDHSVYAFDLAGGLPASAPPAPSPASLKAANRLGKGMTLPFRMAPA